MCLRTDTPDCFDFAWDVDVRAFYLFWFRSHFFIIPFFSRAEFICVWRSRYILYCVSFYHHEIERIYTTFIYRHTISCLFYFYYSPGYDYWLLLLCVGLFACFADFSSSLFLSFFLFLSTLLNRFHLFGYSFSWFIFSHAFIAIHPCLLCGANNQSERAREVFS